MSDAINEPRYPSLKGIMGAKSKPQALLSLDEIGLSADLVGEAGSKTEVLALTDPVQSGDHERFEVRAATGEMLEVDHNTSLAQYVPVHEGDGLVIHGELYIDPGPRYGVHCTHAQTSSGCPNPGWIEYQDNYYE